MASKEGGLRSFQSQIEEISRQHNPVHHPTVAAKAVVPTSPQASKGKGSDLAVEDQTPVLQTKKEVKLPKVEVEPLSTTDEEHDRLQVRAGIF